MSVWVWIWAYAILLSIVSPEQLKYLWGDAINDPLVLSPDGNPYPWELSAEVAAGQLRQARSFGRRGGTNELLSPSETREILLRTLKFQEDGLPPQLIFEENNSSRGQGRWKRRVDDSEGDVNGTMMSTNNNSLNNEHNGCAPSRLCQSTYNTTAPLFGMSLTSGKPITIVQKFPDLLQQVVFQVCKSSDCDVIQGECVQTFIPYLFLVLPLGPVSITGQDYVLVESGCTCQPRYSKKYLNPPLPFIQPIN